MWELDYKKAEPRRTDAFEVWWWRRLLRVSWTARRSNQSILKEVSSGCSLEGLMLKLNLQYFGHLMRRVDSLEKTLMLGRTGGSRRRGWQRMRRWMASPTRWTWVWVNARSWWWTGRPGMLQFTGLQRVRHDWATGLNWTEGMRGKKLLTEEQCKERAICLRWSPGSFGKEVGADTHGELIVYGFVNDTDLGL